MNRELTVADTGGREVTVTARLIRPDDPDETPYWEIVAWSPFAIISADVSQADAARLGAHLLLGRAEAARDALRVLLGAVARDGYYVPAVERLRIGNEALADLEALLPAPAEPAQEPWKAAWDGHGFVAIPPAPAEAAPAVLPCGRCGGSGRVKHGDIGCSRPCPQCATPVEAGK